MAQSDIVLLQSMAATLTAIVAVLLAIKPFDRLMDRLFRR